MRRFGLSAFSVICVSCLLSFPSVTSSSDENTVRIYGTVEDSSYGTSISGASITFISEGDTVTVFSASNGSYEIYLSSVSTGIDEPSAPQEFELRQNYPNPFNPSTLIEYVLSKSANVRIDIFNISGQRIRSLIDEYKETGKHSVHWDSLDDFGNPMAAGIYFYRLRVGEFSETKKMLLLDGGDAGKLFSYANIPSKHSANVAKTADRNYELVVESDGYELYRENGFIIFSDVPILQKDITLKWKLFTITIAKNDLSELQAISAIRDIETEDFELYETPFLTQYDIISYSWSNHHITYTEAIWERLKTWGDLLHKFFVITVGDEKIYWGLFQDALDSSCWVGCNNPVIMLIPRHPDGRNTTPGLLYINRSYLEGYIPPNPDPRIDTRIHTVLEKAGILVD